MIFSNIASYTFKIALFVPLAFSVSQASNNTELIVKDQGSGLNDSLVGKNESSTENKIRGGKGFDQAEELPLRQDLMLKSNLRAGQFQFFYIDMEKPGLLNFELSTTKNGLMKNGRENKYQAFACMDIFNPDRQKNGDLSSVGLRNRKIVKTLDTQRTGRYHIRLGCENYSVRGDGILFKVSKLFFGDLGSTDDAGKSPSKALAIKPGTQKLSFISGSDSVDYYSFAARKGEKYSLGMLPEEDPNGGMLSGSYSIAVENGFKEELFSIRGRPGSGIRPQQFSVPEDGQYYVKFFRPFGREKGVKPYRLIFKLALPAAPPVGQEDSGPVPSPEGAVETSPPTPKKKNPKQEVRRFHSELEDQRARLGNSESEVPLSEGD